MLNLVVYIVTTWLCRVSLVFAKLFLEVWGAERLPCSHASALLVITNAEETFCDGKSKFRTVNDIHALIL